MSRYSEKGMRNSNRKGAASPAQKKGEHATSSTPQNNLTNPYQTIADNSQQQKESNFFQQKATQSPLKKGVTQAKSNAPVQRFTVITPADYAKADEHNTQMFPSQQLEQSVDHEPDTTSSSATQKETHKVNWTTRYANAPALKVSETGKLAIESTVGQPKVFYGQSNLIAKAKQRLVDMGSRITLKAESDSVTVPKTPHNISAETNSLVKVVPIKSPHIDASAPLMDQVTCDQVSSEIVGGKDVIIGHGKDQKNLGEVADGNGKANTIAEAMTDMGAFDTTQDMVAKELHATNHQTDYTDTTRQVTQTITEYFANGMFRREHAVPKQNALKVLSIPGVPEPLLMQVYEYHVGLQDHQRPNSAYIEDLVKDYFKTKAIHEFNETRDNAALHQKLGTNEHAQPEVGESFSTMSLGGPQVIDEKGMLSHTLDTSDMPQSEYETLMTRMRANNTNILRLGKLVTTEYAKARGIVPFAEHHAAVVAKDGGDSVTFENYNRGVERRNLNNDKWQELTERFNQLKDTSNATLQQLSVERDAILNNDGTSPMMKRREALIKQERQLDVLRQNFVEINADTKIKIESNLGQNDREKWHFNMYGPAGQFFFDENGILQGQSFHEKWGGAHSVANAITLRTAASAQSAKGIAVTQELQKGFSAHIYKLLKQKGFSGQKDLYSSLIQPLLTQLNNATTVSQLLDLREHFKSHNSEFNSLSPQEQKGSHVIDERQ